MKKRIFVTGVTRMKHGYVCVSGIDLQTGEFVRPEIHYAGRHGIKKEFLYNQEGALIIKPLVMIELEFLRPDPKSAFHTEDWQIDGTQQPRLVAIPTDDEKRAILSQHTDPSLNRILSDQGRSLIIIRPQGIPECFVNAKEGKIKAQISFRDQGGDLHVRYPVTDANWLAFVRHNWMHHRDEVVARCQKALECKEIYLRIGITREWQGSQWRQISGVFSIPDWLGGQSFADFGYDFVDDV